LGDRAAQIDAYKKAIEMNPSFAEGHLFLAKAYLDAGQDLDEAMRLSQKGVELAPRSEYAPLGHYVMADIYARRGKRAESDAEAARGRALERAPKSQP
ncbi:MAG TPA: tetratricopeptide repeat protein, partial [Sphingomicrobium sp.]